MTIPNILLIGSGQLGSRYLQGLVSIESQLSITVVDSSEASLSAARERLEQVSMSCSHDVFFTTSFDDVPRFVDLALVVTPSHCRESVVRHLVAHFEVKSLILEKLLAQSSEQLDRIEQCLLGHKQVWVNTPRRLMPWHQAMNSLLLPNGPSPLQLRVYGGSWGMACNSIHFIDLLSWWSQASVQSVCSDGLEAWFQSKRPGFSEVSGRIAVSYSDGSELELLCHMGTQPLLISVDTPQGEWVINESEGRFNGPAGQKLCGQLIFQSALTAPLVKQILQYGCCSLPTLSESASQHRQLLISFLDHWNKSQGYQDSIVPIT